MVHNIIKEALKRASGMETVQLGFADRTEHGDYTSNVALQAGGNPRERAQEIVSKLHVDLELKKYVSRTEIAGPGFINFFLDDTIMLNTINEVLSQEKNFAKNDKNADQKVVVEYSSPNISKPFTIGHFRSTIIGDAVANLLASQGTHVYRDNHLGDWGTQFGKQIYAIKTWGNEESIENSENPVNELVKLYVKFHEEAEKDPRLEEEARGWFKKLEDHDAEAQRLWKKCIEWSFTEFDAIYKRLGVSFTENDGHGYGESYFEDKMGPILDELRQKKLTQKGEGGAELVFFENDKYPPLMILKKDGATLYSTRDLATDKWRLDTYGSDVTIINEVGGEQSLYFNQLYELEKMLGWVKEGQRIHIKHGLFRFKDKKMSTRKGNVIWLKDVLNEAYEKATELSSESTTDTDKIAIGAMKWNELKRDPVSDIVFDWDEILNMKGNSGPYMQYTRL